MTQLDLATATTVATWRAGRPSADAVLDGQGTIWALGIDGELHHLVLTADGIDDAEPRPASPAPDCWRC